MHCIVSLKKLIFSIKFWSHFLFVFFVFGEKIENSVQSLSEKYPAILNILKTSCVVFQLWKTFLCMYEQTLWVDLIGSEMSFK